MNITKTLVIARYNEDVSWLKNISNEWNTIVYNKGNDVLNGVKLDNVGREAHTYLYHIVNNYESLADVTAFVQGKPFDHNPSIINTLNQITSVDKFSTFAEGFTHTCNANGAPDHPGLQIAEYAQKHKIKISHNIKFAAGAQFIVPRHIIHIHSIEFYKNLLDSVNQEVKPVGAYILERIWAYIFDYEN